MAKRISNADLGWAAAILDIKGRISFKNNPQRRTPQICLYVESKHLHVIEKLSELTGSAVEAKTQRPAREFMRRNCSEHCPEPHTHVRDEELDEPLLPPTARWTLTGAALAIIVYNTMPFLTDATAKDFEPLMRSILESTPLSGQGSGATLASIRRLAGLGWKLPGEYAEASPGRSRDPADHA